VQHLGLASVSVFNRACGELGWICDSQMLELSFAVRMIVYK
jgi:hypothetical protein